MNQPTRLFNRTFVLLWQGQLISKLGNQANYIALMFWIKHATGSATLMGTVMMATTIPMVLLSPFAGAFADRHRRKSIIVVADIVAGIGVLSLTALLFLSPDATGLITTWMIVVTAISATASAFFGPAFGAAIPDIVPRDRVAAANSLNRFSDQFASMIGMGAGGVLFRVLGAPLLFLFDGLSFLIAALSSSLTHVPQELPEMKLDVRDTFAQLKRDMADGFHYVISNAGLRNLFIVAAFLNFFFAPIGILLPFFVEDTLKSTTDWFGYILAAMGLGSMLGLLWAGTSQLKGQTRCIAIIVSIAGASLLIGLVGAAQTPLQAMVLVFVTGGLTGFVNISIATTLQLTTPTEKRGRVFGLLATLGGGLMPISMGLTGVVTDLVDQNVRLIFLVCGGICVLLTVLVSMNREFRQFLGLTGEA